jgi:hypothetical protein
LADSDDIILDPDLVLAADPARGSGG